MVFRLWYPGCDIQVVAARSWVYILVSRFWNDDHVGRLRFPIWEFRFACTDLHDALVAS